MTNDESDSKIDKSSSIESTSTTDDREDPRMSFAAIQKAAIDRKQRERSQRFSQLDASLQRISEQNEEIQRKDIRIFDGKKWKNQTLDISDRAIIVDEKASVKLKKINALKLGKVSKKLRRKRAGIADKPHELFMSIAFSGFLGTKSNRLHFEVMDKSDRAQIALRIMQRVAELNGLPMSPQESKVTLQIMNEMEADECITFCFDTKRNDGWYPKSATRQSNAGLLALFYSEDVKF